MEDNETEEGEISMDQVEGITNAADSRPLTFNEVPQLMIPIIVEGEGGDPILPSSTRAGFDGEDVDPMLPSPIRTVISSLGRTTMVGMNGQIEVVFDDILAVDKAIIDKGGGFTTVNKRPPRRPPGQGGKKGDLVPGSEGMFIQDGYPVEGIRSMIRSHEEETRLARQAHLETLRKKDSQ
ncbi:hypothetical protein NE237_030396 [Protea cynaroides]|uniref:Uncharacterized protein n=1 Tax=Protea cynaroides TaxID=273540 RepID=A0A9Q0GU06_9MAGN|nr:hypothetical protein NE237_030396 [Protea cynaroides]